MIAPYQSTMKKLSSSQVEHILFLLDQGHSANAISKSTGVSIGKVSSLRSEHCPDLPKSVSGRPHLLTPRDIEYTKHNMRRGKITNAVQAARALQNVTNTRVTPRTVCQGLKNSGWKAIVKRKRLKLTQAHKHARLDFAEHHKEWTLADFKLV
jgi:transposase